MAFRTVYGNTHSENGWPMVDDGSCEWITVPGTDVRLQVATGQPLTILKAFANDYDTYVERLRNADSACWTATNSVGSSNHLSGTACDFDWDSHAFHVSYAGFDQPKIDAMRALLDFYTHDGQKIIWWGQDWGMENIGPYDAMHVNLAPGTFNNPKTADFIAKKIRPDGLSTYKRGVAVPADTAVLVAAVNPAEKVLAYNHAQQSVAQEKFFDCCPASTQIVLDGIGVHMSEDELIRAIGTDTNGTNTVEQALPILNEKAGTADGKYVAQWMPNDPPRPDQVSALWHNVKTSIDSGHGCVLNFQVPSSNFPRATRGSKTPQYRGGVVYHYVSCMGWADDGPGGKHLWISDPGFGPFDDGGYWMALEQVATAIPPHAYAYFVPKVAPSIVAPPPAKPVTPQQPVAPPAAVQPVALNAVGDLEEFWNEWSAIELGDVDSIVHVIRTAASNGTPEVTHRARAVLSKVPRPALSQALGLIEPDVLKVLIGRPA
jgi:hypothetical protein